MPGSLLLHWFLRIYLFINVHYSLFWLRQEKLMKVLKANKKYVCRTFWRVVKIIFWSRKILHLEVSCLCSGLYWRGPKGQSGSEFPSCPALHQQPGGEADSSPHPLHSHQPQPTGDHTGDFRVHSLCSPTSPNLQEIIQVTFESTPSAFPPVPTYRRSFRWHRS